MSEPKAYSTPTEYEKTPTTTAQPPSPYHVKNLWKSEDWIDFYMLYDMFREGLPHQVGDSAIEHAWKKITKPGQRHSKDKIQDLEEAIWSLQVAIKLINKVGKDRA